MNDDEQIVRSALAAPARLPEDVMDRLGDERVTVLLSAATALALRRRFQTHPGRTRILEFTEALQARFPDAAPLIKPIVIEALVGFAFGESELADGASPDDLRTALLVLPYAVISEEDLEGEDLDRFVTEVLQSVYASEQ
ncbi:hypothetical protein [Glycomyces tenuis]|uniref:hypothetical protein n=1 Tax=Glycomyces tenuis TaxID=58116 RepID=UPI0012DF228A|nr:hypothetical protein [Glycomyces tenuis]